MKAQIMKRAWEIYRTLTGDHIAKLHYALKAAWAEIKKAARNVLTAGKHVFEIVDTVPDGYEIWYVGNLIDGYIPLAQVENNRVNPETLKAVKVSDSAMVMRVVGIVCGKGKKIVSNLSSYAKKYKNSKRAGTRHRAEMAEKALAVLSEVKWA